MILIYKRECVLTLLLCLFGGPACAREQHEYVVEIDRGLQRMAVTARFASTPYRLVARSRRAARYLERIESCAGERLRPRGRRVDLDVDCVRYSVDLRRAAAGDRRNATLAPSNLLVSPSLWLWRPATGATHDLVVDFRVADGNHVSAPWEPLEGGQHRYRVRPSPQSASAAVAFGSFHEASREVPGATLRIALMQARGESVRLDLLDWVSAAASNVGLGYGHFPNPDPHVVIVPTGGSRWGSSSPVPFGRVIRDGGESVELFVNQHASLDRLYDDWTATHEFSHFMLPYVGWRQRWVSEGFAQYYQNVLLARAGQYDTERAWQKLYEGFERGRRARPELSPNQAAEQRPRGATMKIYWAGAALALEADVELRRASGGTQSLDTVLGKLARCCLPSPRTWTGPELFGKLDELAGASVFLPLYERYANASGFPDYGSVMESIGLEVHRGRVEFVDDAPLADVRDAIMSVPDT